MKNEELVGLAIAPLPIPCASAFFISHSSFLILHSSFLIPHSSFFILHSSFFIKK